MIRYAIFETAIGLAGVAWGAAGLVGAHLPEASEGAARAGLLRRFAGAEPGEPDANAARAVAGICRLLAGERPDLLDIEIDLAPVPELNARVYAVARAIPPGETLTYGEVAARLGAASGERAGDWRLAQEVGQALGRNPWPIVVPCHRVTAAGGKLGGFSARGGAATKARLLAIEGAAVGRAAPGAAGQGDLFG